ncbi:hypothetical protein CLOM_g14421 [Closterium sp. NIES-68]|nr:hypothetical protein CLOM_g14421 [Closterium sp. NIES-68]GJP75654.1 hypothetical protein CLOP_g6078 [Closterium sp. NIES-67]
MDARNKQTSSSKPQTPRLTAATLAAAAVGGAASGGPGDSSSMPRTGQGGLPNLPIALVLNLAALLEKLDEALLPAVYRSLAPSLNLHYSAPAFSLGTLAFYRCLVQALAAPLAAYLAARGDRVAIIGAGAVAWGVATAAVGLASTYWGVAIARAASGVGLALVLPCIQSLLADLSSEDCRGTAFGAFQASSQLGSLLGALAASALAGRALLGLPGWRAAFHLVALLSVAFGLLLLSLSSFSASSSSSSSSQSASSSFSRSSESFVSSALGLFSRPSHSSHPASASASGSASDSLPVFKVAAAPTAASLQLTRESSVGSATGGTTLAAWSSSVSRADPTPGVWRDESLSSAVGDLWLRLRHVASIRTCQLIMLQGVVGQAPWSALLFLSMWLELIGFDASRAAELVSLLSLGFLLGSLTAGWVGDRAAQYISPLGLGRILCANISTGAVVLLSALLLNVFPPSPSEAAASAPSAAPASFETSAPSGSSSWGFLVLWESAPHALLFCLIGFAASWPLPACNLPLLSEVVPTRLRTTAYAADMALGRLSAAFGGPSVGLAAIHLYGFSTSAAAAAMAGRSGIALAAATSALEASGSGSAAAAAGAQGASGAGGLAGVGGVGGIGAGEVGAGGGVMGAAGAEVTGLAVTAAAAAATAAANTEALAKGLFLAIAVPYAVNVVLIAACFWAYPEDRKHASVANWVDDSSALNGGSRADGAAGAAGAGSTRTKAGKSGKGSTDTMAELSMGGGVESHAVQGRLERHERHELQQHELQHQHRPSLGGNLTSEPGSNETELSSLLRRVNV